MSTAEIDGRSLTVPEPNRGSVELDFGRLLKAFDEAGDPSERRRAIEDWDNYRKELTTWSALAYLRFQQDTADAEAKARKQRRDELLPYITELDNRMKQRLLSGPERPEIEATFGAYAFALWQTGVDSFDPVIAEDSTADAKLCAQYSELRSSMRVEFRGESYNWNGITPLCQDADRDTREAADKARWTAVAESGEQLDSIYDDLVGLRQGMAKKMGFKTFTPLGYLNMRRTDYGPEEVARFRQNVMDDVVPLVAELRERQRRHLGVDRLMHWDEKLLDPGGNPKPKGKPEELVAKAAVMFSRMDSSPEGLGPFFQLMRDKHLMDLVDRPTKSPGGFCTRLASFGVPFVFACFNGTTHDVDVLTHEIGHAFQGRRSRNQPLYDYVGPTSETAEIHSMSLEFLCWPHMGLFFGEDAERYRRLHLSQRLMFLPYGCLVDHFQHEVYARPTMSPAERKATWKELEKTYLPWRDYGDLPHVSEGGFWQTQRHIYMRPFYYIDYTLALTCALQFWHRSLDDYDQTLSDYVALCGRGGELPFGQLVKSAGLRVPFEEGCLRDVVSAARAYLFEK